MTTATGWVHCPECHPGLLIDRRSHTHMHRQWETGVPVPAATLRRHGSHLHAQPVTRIDAYDAPVPLRRLAYRAAQVARREGKWDFASFPYPAAGDYRGSDPEAYGYLRVDGNRVLGYLVVYVEQRDPHWVLGPFWVAGAHRRTGVGRQLFAAAADADAPLAWLAPFTAVGKRFADAMDPDHRIPLSY